MALVGGIFLGTLVGLGRISKRPWVYYPVTVYVNFLRNIPLILVIFWFFFVMPILVGKTLDPFVSAAVSFIVFEATYFGEIFRAGFQSISKDLVSAAYSTGLTYRQTAAYILVPIAFRRMLPSLITQSLIILIVGYMAENTLGRRIEELGQEYERSGRRGEAPLVKFLNKEYPLKAHVAKIGGFSGHADKAEMLRFLKQCNLRIKKIALVHGEESQALHFAESLQREGHAVMVPRRGETVSVG